MKWEAFVHEWESEPYSIKAESFEEVITKLPYRERISHVYIYQIGNPLVS